MDANRYISEQLCLFNRDHYGQSKRLRTITEAGGNSADLSNTTTSFTGQQIESVVAFPPLTFLDGQNLTTAEQQVELLYVAYFRRAGDPAGVLYWDNNLNTGSQTIDRAAVSFGQSQEAFNSFQFLQTPSTATQSQIQTFIESIYENLCNRQADTPGLNYWTAQLEGYQIGLQNLSLVPGGNQAQNLLQFQTDIADFIMDVVRGAQNSSNGQDITTIIDKVTVASFFTNAIEAAGIGYVPVPGTTTALDTESHAVVAATDSSATDTVAFEEAAITTFIAQFKPSQTDLGGAGGVIDWTTEMPVGTDELVFVSAQSNALIIDNAPATFTLDVGHFAVPFEGGDVGNFAGTTALTNSFTLILGDATGAAVFGNPFAVNGAGVVDIIANAPAVATHDSLNDFSQGNTFTANPGGGVVLTISGDASLDSNALFLVGSGASSVIATQTRTLELDAFGGGDGIPAFGWDPAAGVTNAPYINASASGGLFMAAADVGNSGTFGVEIIGSAAHANALAGSAGNDILTGGTAGDVIIITEGGGDIITRRSRCSRQHRSLHRKH
jgi:hypothetical protein